MPLLNSANLPAPPQTPAEPLGNSRRNLDQCRAEHAWNKIEAMSKVGEKQWQDYTGEAHKLPVRIMASGLGQALAFLHAKQKKKPGLVRLIADLSDWVLKQRMANSPIAVITPKSPDLLHAVIESDTEFLRWATDETLAYLQWVNRFAEGLGFEPATDSSE